MTRRASVSYAQMCQRELAWLLYISEGYSANIAHACAVNAATLDLESLRLCEQACEAAEDICDGLRARMGEIGKD